MNFNWVDTIIEHLNRIPAWLFLWVIFCLNFLGFAPNENEEVYFGFAMATVDGSPIKDLFSTQSAFSYHAPFNLIFGKLFSSFNFEVLIFILRLSFFGLLAHSLGRLLKIFELSNIQLLIAFQLFFLLDQNLFGGEWIIKGTEHKVIAYPFAFYAMASLINRKYIWANVFFVLATIFHPLVGSWTALISVLSFFFIKDIDLKDKLKTAICFLVMGPYLIYQLLETENLLTPDLADKHNWINAVIRNPHHLYPFASFHTFMNEWLPGILIMLCLGGFILFTELPKKLALYKNWVLLSCLILVTGLVIGIFDKNGFFLKFYLFRPSALQTLLIIIFCLYVVPIKKVQFLWLLLGIALITNSMIHNAIENYYYYVNRKDLKPIYEYIRHKTPKDSRFLYLSINDHPEFIRLSHRERLSLFSYGKTGKDIFEWYERKNWKDAIMNDMGKFNELPDQYRVDYVFSEKQLFYPTLSLKFDMNGYYLYENESK